MWVLGHALSRTAHAKPGHKPQSDYGSLCPKFGAGWSEDLALSNLADQRALLGLTPKFGQRLPQSIQRLMSKP